MPVRFLLVFLLFPCPGCQMLGPFGWSQAPAVHGSAGVPPASGEGGQDARAPKGNGEHREEADACFSLDEQNLKSASPAETNQLGLAAARLEQGDEAGASIYLARHLAFHPEQANVRAYYAELLLRLYQTRAAGNQFERFDAAVQERGPAANAARIHCQGRLTKIALAEEDEYGEHLHRGIGLYLLAQEGTRLAETDGALSAEGLLNEAALELAEACRLRPEGARACWYLYEVRTRLGQRQQALRWLRAAQAAAPFCSLAPQELRQLQMACQEEGYTR